VYNVLFYVVSFQLITCEDSPRIFDEALSLMALVPGQDPVITPCPEHLRAPPLRKPAVVDNVQKQLFETPSPVVGPQTANAIRKVKSEIAENKKTAAAAAAARAAICKQTAKKKASFKRPHKKSTPTGALKIPLHDVGLPQEAYPQRAGAGKFSYTIVSVSGAVIEVQIRTKAYYLKKIAGGKALPEDCMPLVAWKRHGGVVDAWTFAKERVQW
jgi:hypothetical protein